MNEYSDPFCARVKSTGNSKQITIDHKIVKFEGVIRVEVVR